MDVLFRVDDGFLPTKGSERAAGYDLYARESGTIGAGMRKLISLGIFSVIPAGYEGQIRPRSGLALKYGITVLNSPGTIDEDFRGEWGLILLNTDLNNTFVYNRGDRLAQVVFAKKEDVRIVKIDSLSDDTKRGAGGFGSSGA